jgi:hypothetical protein
VSSNENGPRTQRQALDMVSDVTAAWLAAATAAELFPGVKMSKAQESRVDAASNEVIKRLFAMGSPRKAAGE